MKLPECLTLWLRLGLFAEEGLYAVLGDLNENEAMKH